MIPHSRFELVKKYKAMHEIPPNQVNICMNNLRLPVKSAMDANSGEKKATSKNEAETVQAYKEVFNTSQPKK